jgi:LuxR family transcriptional regulator, maltose regulon positive regulatory protein
MVVGQPTTPVDIAEREAYEPPLAILEWKLTPPFDSRETVSRVALLHRLEAAGGTPVVAVTAPAGYGKTTLLAQWAQRDPRPFAWLSIDHHDNDPAVLLTYIAVALDRVESINPAVFQALASSDARLARTAPLRLGAALSAKALPAVLVLDGFHLLQSRECLDAVVTLVEHLPGGSQLVIASRNEPSLPMARLRAAGDLVEIGRDDLAMDDREVGLVLRAEGTDVSDAGVAELTRRTEGWPAALRLADPVGDDRFLADYLGSVLPHLSGAEARFLIRTSVLDRMSGPLCDAVLERPGSAAVLESLERSNLLVIPLDRRRRWYRYHNLFRESLRAELQRREPELVRQLNVRAAGWYERNGLPEDAIAYAMEADDDNRVARLVEQVALQVYCRGRLTTFKRWFDWLDGNGLIERHPTVAVLGAWVHALMGQPAAAERFADMAERGPVAGTPMEGWLAVLRAGMCRAGVEQLRADAKLALTLVPVGSLWRAPAHLLLGISHLLAGESNSADGILAGAFEVAEDVGAMVTASIALTERCILAMRREDWSQAEVLAERACSIVRRARLEEYATTVLLDAVAAQVALRRGDAGRAHKHLARAQRLRPQLTYALPFHAVQARLELIRAYIALTDVAGGRTVLREVDDLLRRRPDLGVLSTQADKLRSQLDMIRADGLGASSLTAAELRLFPCLASHRSFREIGRQLHVSPHTVKSQAMSIYRKLGVSSRSQAIRRARDLGVLAT